MNYKDFQINTVTTKKPWGAREEQTWKDIIDTMVKDCCKMTKDVNGHKHKSLYSPDCTQIVYTDDNYNLGIGVTPNTGWGLKDVVEFYSSTLKDNLAIAGGIGQESYISKNAYNWDGGDSWKFMTVGYATKMEVARSWYKFYISDDIGIKDGVVTFKEFLGINFSNVVINQNNLDLDFYLQKRTTGTALKWDSGDNHFFIMGNTAINKASIEAWDSGSTALQIGGTGAFICGNAEAAGQALQFLHNIYFGAGVYKKYVNDEAERYLMFGGAHIWSSDIAAAADTEFTPTEKMRLTLLGNLCLGTATEPTANGTKVITLGDNGATGPTMGANTAGFYAKDVDTVMSPFAIDEDGNEQQLAPHDHKTKEWISYTGTIENGKMIRKKYRMETLMNHLINLLNKHGIKDDTLFQLTEESL